MLTLIFFVFVAVVLGVAGVVLAFTTVFLRLAVGAVVLFLERPFFAALVVLRFDAPRAELDLPVFTALLACAMLAIGALRMSANTNRNKAQRLVMVVKVVVKNFM